MPVALTGAEWAFLVVAIGPAVLAVVVVWLSGAGRSAPRTSRRRRRRLRPGRLSGPRARGPVGDRVGAVRPPAEGDVAVGDARSRDGGSRPRRARRRGSRTRRRPGRCRSGTRAAAHRRSRSQPSGADMPSILWIEHVVRDLDVERVLGAEALEVRPPGGRVVVGRGVRAVDRVGDAGPRDPVRRGSPRRTSGA